MLSQTELEKIVQRIAEAEQCAIEAIEEARREEAAKCERLRCEIEKEMEAAKKACMEKLNKAIKEEFRQVRLELAKAARERRREIASLKRRHEAAKQALIRWAIKEIAS